MVEPRGRYPIDDLLVGRLDVAPGDVVLELGCGRGFTLLAAAERADGVVALGVDLDGEVLALAQALVDEAGAAAQVAVADLGAPLPVATSSVTKVLCHNVLEQLADPAALMVEASRVLRPGGLSIWSHTDFESVVISGGDPDLSRRVVAADAASVEPGGRHGDGQMGRKLPALIHASPLARVAVDAQVLLSTELSGPAEVRVRTTFAVLRAASLAGETDITVEDLERWVDGLRAGAARGEFLYAHTTFVVAACEPA